MRKRSRWITLTPLFDVLGLLLFENLGLAMDDQECDFKLMTVHGSLLWYRGLAHSMS